MSFKTQPMRSLPRASTRLSLRTAPTARFQRNYATGGEEPPPSGKKPGGFPVAPVAAALTIPAIAWFFMGRTPATDKGGVTKNQDPRHEAVNEEQSRSVPHLKPDSKETKPANPKAVAPDDSRLASERTEKSNSLTGTGK